VRQRQGCPKTMPGRAPRIKYLEEIEYDEAEDDIDKNVDFCSPFSGKLNNIVEFPIKCLFH
jgi:hypothetical protein